MLPKILINRSYFCLLNTIKIPNIIRSDNMSHSLLLPTSGKYCIATYKTPTFQYYHDPLRYLGISPPQRG